MSNMWLVQSVYDSFARGDVPSVLGAFAANIEWREAEGNPMQPNGAAWVGPDAVLRNLFMRIAAEWDGFKVTTKHFHDAGAAVAVEGRYTGAYKKTGRSIDAQFCHVWRIRDGKIASFQQFVDTAQLQNAMGAA